jgi:hypothetical protein
MVLPNEGKWIVYRTFRTGRIVSDPHRRLKSNQLQPCSSSAKQGFVQSWPLVGLPSQQSPVVPLVLFTTEP